MQEYIEGCLSGSRSGDEASVVVGNIGRRALNAPVGVPGVVRGPQILEEAPLIAGGPQGSGARLVVRIPRFFNTTSVLGGPQAYEGPLVAGSPQVFERRLVVEGPLIFSALVEEVPRVFEGPLFAERLDALRGGSGVGSSLVLEEPPFDREGNRSFGEEPFRFEGVLPELGEVNINRPFSYGFSGSARRVYRVGDSPVGRAGYDNSRVSLSDLRRMACSGGPLRAGGSFFKGCPVSMGVRYPLDLGLKDRGKLVWLGAVDKGFTLRLNFTEKELCYIYCSDADTREKLFADPENFEFWLKRLFTIIEYDNLAPGEWFPRVIAPDGMGVWFKSLIL